jgi:hypothetical protein
MFQTEIKFITDFTLNNVKKLGAFFTFEKLLDTNIHPAIKQYLNAEFEYLIYEDRQKLIERSLFDYSGAKITHYFTLISEEIKKTKKVSYEDIKTLISRAISFNVSYVIKPNWSLQKLVFGEKKSIPVSELELVLNYPYYYDYFKNVFRAYLSKRSVVNITSTEFELIINKVDRELFSAHFEKLVDNSIASIADFFSIGGLNKKSVSVEAVELFLKEKNLIDHLLKLKRAIPDPGRKKYDIDDIRKIIFSATPIEPNTISPTIDDELTKEDGEFEKVKTLEEVEIKPLTQSQEDDTVDEKSDENIIQEIVQDEIVKHEIEELIEVESPAEEILEDETEELFEEEIVEQQPSEELSTTSGPDEILPEEEIIEDTNEEELSEQKLANISTDTLVTDDAPDKEITPSEEVLDDEELLDILSEETDANEEISLLSDKEEEDLFSFYDKELKDSPELNDGDEIINLDELELKADDLSEEEITHTQSKSDDSQIPVEKVEIEKESSEEELTFTPAKKNRDIFSFLTSKEIDKITDAIFSSDSEDFANTIERISECESYEKATEILKALFSSGKISPQSKQAVLLTNAVANYFDQV